jgi:carbon-monoxide dehydrogenase medium subunit
MRPRPFEYYPLSSLSEALNLLSSREDAKTLAGGQSLVTLMKLHLVSPKALIDINGIADLTHVREEGGVIAVGALTRHDQLAKNGVIRQKAPLLVEAASVIADQQVRNRGTIGGSLAHADPAADLPTACTAIGATIVAASVKGSRSVSSADFFHGYFTTSLRRDEVIQEVRIPIPPSGSGSAYLKLTKGQNDFAVVGVAAQVTLESDYLCKAVSVVLGGVAPTPCHAEETEKSLLGRRLDNGVIDEAAEKASEGIAPPSDVRASAEYRLKMVKILTKRAVRIAVSRAHEGV